MNTELTAGLRGFIAQLGYRLWGVRWHQQGRDRHLQVFIDRDEGINVDDCALVSRNLGVWLDVELAHADKYVLEVSSPGVDRLLFDAQQFRQYQGCLVALRLRRKVAGRKKMTAQIVNCTDSSVELALDEEKLCLPLQDILEARLSSDGHFAREQQDKQRK